VLLYTTIHIQGGTNKVRLLIFAIALSTACQLRLQISYSVYVPKIMKTGRLAVDKVIAKISRLTLFGAPCTLYI